jgi:hypothetical protein
VLCFVLATRWEKVSLPLPQLLALAKGECQEQAEFSFSAASLQAGFSGMIRSSRAKDGRNDDILRVFGDFPDYSSTGNEYPSLDASPD